MVRISIGKPAIVRGENNWGVPTDLWYVKPYGYVDRATWRKLKEFQSAVVPGTRTAVQKRLELNPKKTLVWEFNAQRGNDFVRMYTVYGKETLVRISLIDVLFRIPLLKLKAAWMTKRAARKKALITSD